MVVAAVAASAVADAAEHYYVSPSGSDAAPGTFTDPTTLEGARDKIRALGALPQGGVLVYLRGGDYPRTSSFALSVADSGTADRSIVYRSFPGERARLVGGRTLDPSWFSLVAADSPAWSRLPAPARGQALVVDLGAHGIDDMGTLVRRGYSTSSARSALELSFSGRAMTLARWPNQDETAPLGGPATVTNPTPSTTTISPAVTGTFDFIGYAATGNANDGYPNYQRRGLVDGIQYYLYHCTWSNGRNRYWFISQHSPLGDANCWPTDGPAWAVSGDVGHRIAPMRPLTAAATGTVLAQTQAVADAYSGFLAVPDQVSATSFHFPGARYSSWPSGADIWLQGLFGNLWADDTLPATIDGSGLVTLGATPSYGLVAGQPFFVLNLLEELDQPGEWYLDRGARLLYFWPPSPLASASLGVSLLSDPLLRAVGTSHVSFDDMDFDLARGNLVRFENTTSVRLRYSRLRGAGSDAIFVSGFASGVEHSLLLDAGAGGVILDGGSRSTLTPAGNYVRDSEIGYWGRWDRTYRPAVRPSGCGQLVEHNHLHDSSHSAIRFTGNDHSFTFNRIARVTSITNDAGAIYTGRDWGYQGSDISFNFLHHIESAFGGSHGIYLDDAASGIRVFGNTFYGLTGLATLAGGGRDNTFTNNVIVDARGTHSTDRRARVSANNSFEASGRPNSWNLLGRLDVDFDTYLQTYPNVHTIDHRSGIWASRYPALAAVPGEWSQVSGTHWLEPEGNAFARNIHWRSAPGLTEGTWGGSGALGFYADTSGNLDADPLFVDEAALDLTLRPESPAFSIPGFQRVPFASIGIRPSARRTLTVIKGGSGIINSVDGGIDCGPVCQAWFDNAATVTLRARHDAGTTFSGWGGPCGGTGDCVVTLSTDVTVTASFGGEPPLHLVIEDSTLVEGSGGTSELTFRVRLSSPGTLP